MGEYNEEQPSKAQSVHISPYGLEFQVPDEYESGTLLKIDVTLPNYWNRKQQFVDYARIDTPKTFKILAKVVQSQEVGKRGKKKLVTAQTLNIDEVDEQVLREYLKEENEHFSFGRNHRRRRTFNLWYVHPFKESKRD